MTMDRTYIWNHLKKETFDFDIDPSAIWKRYPWFSCDRGTSFARWSVTNLCCSTAALYYYAPLSRYMTVLCCCALSKRSATVFCCCALLLHSTAALYFYALLLRSTAAVHHNALLLRSSLILYYCASRYRILPTIQWSSKQELKAIQRDRPNDWDKETLKFTSRTSRHQSHQLLGDFRIFYVLWVDSFFSVRNEIKRSRLEDHHEQISGTYQTRWPNRCHVLTYSIQSRWISRANVYT